MKILHHLTTLAVLSAVATSAVAKSEDRPTLVVTASNSATSNQLLVYSASNHLVQALATGGKGGVSGNSGGIAASRDHLAVVNFASQNVSIFEQGRSGFRLQKLVPSVSRPQSVAFGHHHLYILGATEVESHPIDEHGIASSPDGVAGLYEADGSAAQVGVVQNQLIVSEKNNAIETFNLNADGAVTGSVTLVQNIPANVNAPFGLVTRDDDAYVTIAHANEISLVRHDQVLTVTGSGTQSAPCWLALDGPFLFSSNSPSKSISRYAVYGRSIVQDAAVAATTLGAPTDIAYGSGLVAVIDASAGVSRLSIFHADEDGNLALEGVSTINSPANGVAIIPSGE
jgi:hypothetical protein